MYGFYGDPISGDEFLQGDILKEVPFSTPLSPNHKDIQGRKLSSISFTRVGIIKNILIDVKCEHGMILSQSCDIQRSDRNNLLICPVKKLSFLKNKLLEREKTEVQVSNFINQLIDKKINYWFYIPENNGLEESYADFTMISSIDKSILDTSSRIFSLTPYSRQWLQYSLMKYLGRPF